MQVCKCERGAHNTGRARREREECAAALRCNCCTGCCAAFSQKPPHVPEQRAATLGDIPVAQRKRRECAGTDQSTDRTAALRLQSLDWGLGFLEGDWRGRGRRKRNGRRADLRDQHQRAPSAGPSQERKMRRRAGQARPSWASTGQLAAGTAAKLGKDPGAPLAGRRQGWCSAVQPVQHGLRQLRRSRDGTKGRWVEVVSRSG